MELKNQIYKDFFNNLIRIIRLQNTQREKLIIMIVLALFCMIINLIIPYFWGQITNDFFYGLQNDYDGYNTYDITQTINLIIILAVLYVSGFFFDLLKNLISAKISNEISRTLRKKIIHKINYLPISYLEKNENGDVISRIINDVETIGNTVTNFIEQIITTSTLLVASVIMMFLIQPILATVTLIIIPVSYVFIKIIINYSQEYYVQKSKQLGQINSFMDETINGLSIINIFDKKDKFKQIFKSINNDYYNISIKTQLISQITKPIMIIVQNLSYIVSVALGAILCMFKLLTVGDIVAFVQYLNNVLNPLQSIFGIFNSVQSMAASTKRIFDYLNLKDEDSINNNCKHKKLPSNTKQPIIYFKNVSFAYDEHNYVIKNFSLKIYQGQSVAIVGPTGSGKTTIIKLLLKFYNNYEGDVYLEGHNLRDIPASEVRNKISIVLQRNWMYSATIAENIKFGKLDSENDEIVNASKLAHAHNFINNTKHKYSTMLNENGSNFSNGQKQLIAMARALISKKDIIILDEATSSVDSNTEKEIYKAFDDTIKNKTSIVIAHRLSTIINADKIIIINHGRIIEEGSHAELLSNKGFYYELFNSGLQNSR